MGRDFCKTLALFSDPDTTYYKQILSELQYNSDMQDNNHYMHQGFQDMANQNEKPTGRYGKSTKNSNKNKSKDPDNLKGLLTTKGQAKLLKKKD